MDDIFYEQLGSTEPMMVLSGLIGISNDIKDMDVPPHYANMIYHQIIPLLNHNHYKIRAIAFSLAETIFVKNVADLTDISLSIPILIFSLSSVNKNIIKSADVCLRVIFETFDLSVWWDDVEDNILHSKSSKIRIHLLELLLGLHSYGIVLPLDAIVQILDDKNVEIRGLAEKVLLGADDDRVKESLRKSKISYDVYQKIYKTFISQQKSKVLTEHPAGMNTKRMQRKPLNATKKIDMSSDLNNENSESNLNNKKRNRFGNDSSSVSKNGTRRQGRRGAPSDNSEYVPRLGRKKLKTSISNTNKNDADDLNDGTTNDLNQNNRPKNVGTIVPKEKRNMPFALRDMSKMSWLEKTTFLDHFNQLFDANFPFSTPINEITQCLLTAAFPLHVKVTPLLANLLTKISYQNPEVLHIFLIDIMRFFLHSIRPPAILNNQNGAEKLLDAILLESSPDELIEASLTVRKENQRPLLIEEVVLLIYKKKPDTILSQITIRNLLCYLLHNTAKSESKDKLIYLICQKETDEVIKFYNIQSREIRRQLLHYIPPTAIEKAKSRPTKEKEFVPVKTQNQLNLLAIVKTEMKKGAKGNFKKLALALQNVHFDNEESFHEHYVSFLKYLAKLPEGMIKANSTALCDVCCSTFNSQHVFHVFDPPFVRPQIVKGFNIFVWHCPMTLLSSATVFYDKLYEIFKEADGDERKQIVGITMAIEKVTNISFLSVESMIKPHKVLIQKLIDQFDVLDS
ncbi:hypothetical protein TRFO_04847 [Tritrichomonas foetus]|uniref:Uncharacterized protein n=1 Tax=Tritrichomonas foetus TaxID=1144522 RepID=A0A1J4KCN9_9EUKA|nr:hypothetical protein TRFO_04847 [Tritrichomonas foetus]|eukprot:OHT08738.1 hypothetical protein TRFO_04847 [Tritrichomonas foetus]